MFIIGELINGMYARIGEAIRQKDARTIQECAIKQLAAGADALDVNCGPASRQPAADMQWLIASLQEVTDRPLSIDSSKPDVIKAGLEVIKNPAIINSTTADEEKLQTILPLAMRHKAGLIGLTISVKGIPQNKDQRLELAAQICAACAECGMAPSDLYLDPIVLPVNVAQAQMQDILESIRDFKIICDPPPNTIVGLSNVSQGTKVRPLVNRTFLTMAVAYGLDAAILDPLDTPLMDAAITAELILNKQIYCDSYLDAYKKK